MRYPKLFMHKNPALKTTGAGLLLLAIMSCGNSKEKQQQAAAAQAPQSFPAFKISARTATLSDQYPATIQGQQNIDIHPKVDGYIDHIYVDEGSVVKKGQLLFHLSAPQYIQDVNNANAAIASAESDVATAELQVKKTKPLVDQDIISPYELESYQNTLKAKQAALKQAYVTLANAKINLGYTTITSPVDGVVGTIPYRLGSLITSSSSSPMTTVSSIGTVYAYFSINEKELLEFSKSLPGKTMSEKLKSLPPVSLMLADSSIYPKTGRVETIAGSINTQTGTANFRAGFPNTSGLIRNGGSAVIEIPQTIPNAILIPQKATYELQGKRFAYVVGDNGKVKNTEIKIMDNADKQFYVVTSGLKAGDTVILEGTSNLQDGMAVKPDVQSDQTVYQGLN